MPAEKAAWHVFFYFVVLRLHPFVDLNCHPNIQKENCVRPLSGRPPFVLHVVTDLYDIQSGLYSHKSNQLECPHPQGMGKLGHSLSDPLRWGEVKWYENYSEKETNNSQNKLGYGKMSSLEMMHQDPQATANQRNGSILAIRTLGTRHEWNRHQFVAPGEACCSLSLHTLTCGEVKWQNARASPTSL